MYPRTLLIAAAALLLTACATPQRDVPDRVGPLEIDPVADGVYALIGPTAGRTEENRALNANYGVVITDEGAALIDSGAAPVAAEVLHEAVRAITDEPVEWVLNTGSQDHRWLGNSYFAERGAEIIALERTVAGQKEFAEEHMERMEEVLGEEAAADIEPVHADEPAGGDRHRVELGGRTLELRYFGDAHFPGDANVWLPEEEILFSGDMVYVDRMLGVHEWSDVASWQEAFHEAMETLEPKTIVPGHGKVSSPEKVRAETGDYLDYLVEKVGADAKEWDPLNEVMDRYREAPDFEHLRHFDDWHPTNMNRTYLQFEE
ncbi:MBL fold metallo-hydrolase [Thiohalospira sp.]|uniref:MBL fold metallo-hydrolase n=1 Tax=Thiohalospira sp. TaxID=3080549 RepID=UPI003980448A